MKKNTFTSRDNKAQEKKGTLQKKEDTATELKQVGENYIRQAEKIKIENEADHVEAVRFLNRKKESEALAKAEMNKVLEPAKKIVKVETERWKPVFDVFKKVDELVRGKVVKYINDKEAKAAAELATLQKKIDAGSITKEETIDRKREEIYAGVPSKTVHTGIGGSTIRKIKKLKIENPALIPDEFWIIDEVKLREAVIKLERQVPGATWEYENSISII